MTLPCNRYGRWTPSSAEGRWCGFGPYYAMFPVDFVHRTIGQFCPENGRVLDPFCGRGTTPFVAAVTGREGFGADVNQIAWLYSSVKLDPCKRPILIKKRIDDVLSGITARDREARNNFQEFAWHSDVLGFLHAARRILKWKSSLTDRTLMGLILIHLHAKRGEGLSNQMRQSKAMSPDYAVRWWKRHKMTPPKIDIRAFFSKKLEWRYKKGVPKNLGKAVSLCGDAREILPRVFRFDADLVLTSPPYFGVTNYDYDNWIRHWMLGGPPLPKYSNATRYSDPDSYSSLLDEVFSETARLTKDKGTIYVRTDAREFTLGATIDTLTDLWPKHRLSIRFDTAPGLTQTGLFHEEWNKAGEVDLLLTPRGKSVPRSFFAP